VIVCFFFFSSRRRHTRFSRDWSSDVCSSDLAGGRGRGGAPWVADLIVGRLRRGRGRPPRHCPVGRLEPPRPSGRRRAGTLAQGRFGPVAHGFARRGKCPLARGRPVVVQCRSEEHTSELQSRENLVCRLLLEKK